MKLRINPWLTDEATRFLNNLFKWLPQLIKSDGKMNVLEWGGGNSTLWLLQKGCKILTVENNQTFIDNLFKIAELLGFRTMISKSASESLSKIQDFDCIILQADKFDDIGEELFSHENWDIIINDGIDRLKVIEKISCYDGAPITSRS